MEGRVTHIALIAVITILFVGCGGGATSQQNDNNSLTSLSPNQAVQDNNEEQINPLDPEQQEIIPPLIVPKEGPLDPTRVSVDVRADSTHISFGADAVVPSFIDEVRKGVYTLSAGTFNDDEILISSIIRNRRFDDQGFKTSYGTSANSVNRAWVRIQVRIAQTLEIVQEFTISDQVIEAAPATPVILH